MFTRQEWLRTVTEQALAPNFKINSIDNYTCFQGGTVQGKLVGGNLSLLCSLCGTPWQPNFEGGILFLEDTDRPTVFRLHFLPRSPWLFQDSLHPTPFAQPGTGANSLHASRQLLRAAAPAPHSSCRSVWALASSRRSTVNALRL